MLVLVIVVLSVLFALTYMSKNENLAYLIVFLGIVFLKTFVDIHSLPDLPAYYTGYKELIGIDWLQVPFKRLWTLKCPEIGFRYILKIGTTLGSFKWSLLLVALINTFAYLSITKKYSPYPWISVIIMFLGITQSFFVIRQHCAIGFTLLSWPYIINRDFKKFILCLIAGFLCHQTALVFLPVYFIYGIKDYKKLILTIVAGGSILLASFVFILQFFINNLVGYGGYKNSNLGNGTSLLISLCYLITYVWFLKKDLLQEGIVKLIFVLLALNSTAMLAVYQFTGINRLMMYYSVCAFISVPITAYFINDKMLKIIYLVAVIGMQAFMFFMGSNAEYLETFKLDIAL